MTPPTSVDDYTKGIFVVNQGTFSLPGSVTWHNPDNGKTIPDLYAAQNNGALLGQFVQSLTFIDDKAYIVVNGANRIVVVKAATFEYIDTIGGLALPRYIQSVGNGIVYVSQWGADGLTGSLAKVDLATRKVVKTITTGNGPEQMVLRDDHSILVANSGGYGVDSTVSVVDLISDTETSRTSVHAKNPCCLALTHINGDHFQVLCSGSYLDAAPAGRLSQLDNGSGFSLPPFGSSLAVNSAGDQAFACAGGNVYRLDQTGLNLFFTQSSYCLAVSAKTGKIHCGDAKDFSSLGDVTIYTSAGVKESAFQAGYAPAQIVILE